MLSAVTFHSLGQRPTPALSGCAVSGIGEERAHDVAPLPALLPVLHPAGQLIRKSQAVDFATVRCLPECPA
jgi:hypothetical protein